MYHAGTDLCLLHTSFPYINELDVSDVDCYAWGLISKTLAYDMTRQYLYTLTEKYGRQHIRQVHISSNSNFADKEVASNVGDVSGEKSLLNSYIN